MSIHIQPTHHVPVQPIIVSDQDELNQKFAKKALITLAIAGAFVYLQTSNKAMARELALVTTRLNSFQNPCLGLQSFSKISSEIKDFTSEMTIDNDTNQSHKIKDEYISSDVFKSYSHTVENDEEISTQLIMTFKKLDSNGVIKSDDHNKFVQTAIDLKNFAYEKICKIENKTQCAWNGIKRKVDNIKSNSYKT